MCLGHIAAEAYIKEEALKVGMQKEKSNIAKNMFPFNEPEEKVHQFTGLIWAEMEALIREQETFKQY